MNLYDFNKSLIVQMPCMLWEDVLQKNKEIWEFCDKTQNKYYMLLCYDVRYFTLFERVDSKPFTFIENAVIECARDIGDIVAIETREDAIEIWVKNDNEAFVMYFFPYDAGVIKCR